MKTKIAINGLGRIGRNAFKVAFERLDLEIVAVNDLADAKTLAHLLRHDSNYGTYQHEVGYDQKNLVVEGQKIKVLAEKEPANLPWKDLDVQIVVESTGAFTDPTKARAHIEAGAKKVIISAPTKGGDAETIVIGVNEDKLPDAGDIISNASCTTNCITPVAAIIESNFGISKATMTTVHSYTASQRLQDAPAKDLREARNAATNIVPTTTGASIAAAKALPALEGIFGGLSIRVPTPVVSLCDFAVVTKRDVTVEEVNEAFKKAAADPYYQGILAVTEEELVSSDFIGNSHSAIVDLKLTNVVGGDLLKVVAWYDNEWGYSNRLIELVADIGKLLGNGVSGAKNDEPKAGHLKEDSKPETKKATAPSPAPKEQPKEQPKGGRREETPEEKSAGPIEITDELLGNISGQTAASQGSTKRTPEAKPYTIIANLPDDFPPPAPKRPEKDEAEALLTPPDSAKKELLEPPTPERKKAPEENKHAYVEDKPSKPEPESLELPEADAKPGDSKFHRF